MSEWLLLDDVCARARASGASGHALGEILQRAVLNQRVRRVTGLLAEAPIERVREHWPADAALLEWMAAWTMPGDLAERLLTRSSGPFGIETGNRLRAMINWGDGVPPWEVDTCVFANVRVCWPEVAGELAAAGFVLPPEWGPIASPREQPQTTLAAEGGAPAGLPDLIRALAEWIYVRHQIPPQKFTDLLTEAQHDRSLGTFKREQFKGAYVRVYKSKAHRPPITGWPLRSPYVERWAKEQEK